MKLHVYISENVYFCEGYLFRYKYIHIWYSPDTTELFLFHFIVESPSFYLVKYFIIYPYGAFCEFA